MSTPLIPDSADTASDDIILISYVQDQHRLIQKVSAIGLKNEKIKKMLGFKISEITETLTRQMEELQTKIAKIESAHQRCSQFISRNEMKCFYYTDYVRNFDSWKNRILARQAD